LIPRSTKRFQQGGFGRLVTLWLGENDMQPIDEEPDEAFAQSKLIEAVENQLASGEPAAAQATLNKLTLVGYGHDESLELMAQILAHCIGVMLDTDQPFDNQAYEQGLRNLPELPEGPAED
tara:strand:- start:138 stop:500 length:363 start_codon:yes stop_codon:yes gene_type:complete